MNYDDLNDLPKWDDHEFNDDDGEGWKPNETKIACKAMYLQWGTVITVLKAAFDSFQDPVDEQDLLSLDMMKDHISMIMSDAFEVAVKINSSEAGLYIIRMENAAIIRKNAQFIKISTNGFASEGLMEPQHRQIIRDEIDYFRELFKVWVNTFKKDEFEDEWGLFV